MGLNFRHNISNPTHGYGQLGPPFAGMGLHVYVYLCAAGSPCPSCKKLHHMVSNGWWKMHWKWGSLYSDNCVNREYEIFLATVNVHKMLLVSFHNNIGQLWLHFDFFLCYKLQTSQLYKFQWSDVHKWITNIAILASCIGTGFSPNKGQNYCAFQYWRAKEREPLAVWWTTPHFSSSLTCWLIVTSDPCLRCQCTAALFMPPPPHSVQPHSHPLSHPVKARLNLKASPEVRLPGHLKHPNPGPRVPTLVPKPPGAQKRFVLPTTIPGCSRTCLQASATFSLGQTMIHASIGTWCTGLALEQHLDDGFWDLQPWMAQRPPP